MSMLSNEKVANQRHSVGVYFITLKTMDLRQFTVIYIILKATENWHDINCKKNFTDQHGVQG